MKVKIDLKMEILEGEDKGYILEETNKVLDLQTGAKVNYYGGVIPYRVTLNFVTPNLIREWREQQEEVDNDL